MIVIIYYVTSAPSILLFLRLRHGMEGAQLATSIIGCLKTRF